MNDQYRQQIAEIVDQLTAEWWDQANAETFVEVGVLMFQRGFTIEEIADALGKLFRAVADEFGG